MSTPVGDEDHTVLRPAPARPDQPLVAPPSTSGAPSPASYAAGPSPAQPAPSATPLIGPASQPLTSERSQASYPGQPAWVEPPAPYHPQPTTAEPQASYQAAQPSAAPVPAAATIEHNPPAPGGADIEGPPPASTPIGDGGIATIAPTRPALMNGYPLSARTGEPQRPVLLAVSCGLFTLGSVIAAAGLVKVLWDAATITGYHDAATLLHWVKPEPVSFLTIVMVLLIGVLGVLTVGAPGVAAFNGWNGERRTRWLGVAAAGISLLTFLLNPLSMISIIPVAAAAGLLWLPQVRAYADAWASIRPSGRPPLPQWADDVMYGPLPRYR